jgi:hypothetical protein
VQNKFVAEVARLLGSARLHRKSGDFRYNQA